MDWPFLDLMERALVAEALPLAGAARAALERQLARLGRVAEIRREASTELARTIFWIAR